MSIKAILSQCLEVGKNIKSSKKRYIWKFRIDEKEHTLELFASLSGKKKVVHNGRTLREESSLFGTFNYNMTIQNNLLTIYNTGDAYDLRINNMQFSYLFHNVVEKTKKEFEFEDGYKEQREEPIPVYNSKRNKPLVKEQDEGYGYDLGLADGFENMAPSESSQTFTSVHNTSTKLNLRIGGDHYQTSGQKKQPVQTQQQPQQSQNFNEFNNFSNFGNFPKPTSQPPASDNVFSNFGNFSFEPPPQQKPPQQPVAQQSFGNFANQGFGNSGSGNPFESPEKSIAPQQSSPPIPPQPQAPPKPKVQETNLIDFMDDTPPQPVSHPQQTLPQPVYNQPPAQQPPKGYYEQTGMQQLPVQHQNQIPLFQQGQMQPQQSQQPPAFKPVANQQKQLPQDILDAFDSPGETTQYQRPPPQVYPVNQGYPQQNLYGQPQPQQQPQQQHLYQQPHQQPTQQPQQFVNLAGMNPPTQSYTQAQQAPPAQLSVPISQLYQNPQIYVPPQSNMPVQVNVKPLNQTTPFDELF